MNIYDEQGTPLMSAKLKSHSLNVALSRQTLIEIIQSYVEESSIHTGFKVTKIEQTSCKVTYILPNRKVNRLICVLVLMGYIL